jgi:PAS domain S-box-containing protein/putative nucleotidyltransferase with HDIG domain
MLQITGCHTPMTNVSLQSFLNLVNGLACGAAVVDHAGVVVHANERLAKMLRRPAAQIVGLTMLDLYTGENAQRLLRDVEERFEQPREREAELNLAEGATLPVIASASALSVGSNGDEYRLITMIDISPQKQAENDLREQYRIVTELSNTILDQAEHLKGYSQRLEDKVRERTAELHEANVDAIYMLAVASEAKDQDTGRHVRRLQKSSMLLARELGFDAHTSEQIGQAAVLHDVGKMHIPDQILQKPGPLTAEERATMKQHTVLGERILVEKPFFARARRVARSHHENWDGSGYPDGTGGANIPIEARIVHLVDIYDALISRRSYKEPWPADRAAAAIHEAAGKMFDPELVRAFNSIEKRGAFDRGGSSAE